VSTELWLPPRTVTPSPSRRRNARHFTGNQGGGRKGGLRGRGAGAVWETPRSKATLTSSGSKGKRGEELDERGSKEEEVQSDVDLFCGWFIIFFVYTHTRVGTPSTRVDILATCAKFGCEPKGVVSRTRPTEGVDRIRALFDDRVLPPCWLHPEGRGSRMALLVPTARRHPTGHYKGQAILGVWGGGRSMVKGYKDSWPE